MLWGENPQREAVPIARDDLNLKRLSLASARLEILIRTDTDLKAQCLELIELRERLQKATRARKPAPVVIVAAA
jgi:hypothetical protein